MELLPTTTLAAAAANQLSPRTIALRLGARGLLLEANFVRAGGGTTAKFWVQTRVKDGTWRDIACFAFTTSSAKKWHAIKTTIAVAPAIAVSDAQLGDDTILDGFLGDELRVKYTTTGTYSGDSSIAILATVQF
jgi:hypothetical protein